MSSDRSRGRFEGVTIESDALRGNPLGDPHERPLWVYLPPGYERSDRRYPAVYVIQGMTGMVEAWFNVSPFAENFPRMVEQLAPDCLVVLVDEVVPFVDGRYRTLAAREHRGIQGKSSGGYGAMITPVLRPDLFGGLATHAGDALFEWSYGRDFPVAVRALRDEYG